MIYTSYFSNVRNLPSNVYPISIARKSPDGWSGAEYKLLAPKWSLLSAWKENHDNDYYVEEYYKQTLNRLCATSVVREILRLCPEGMEPCLICYEKPDDFCHRHIVAKWMEDNGYIAKEY